jgi:sugar phosphate isomerase/epimerase
MKLIISNLSWNSDEDYKVINIIKKLDIKNIEISANKIFNNNYTLKNIKKNQHFWRKEKIKFYSMQSILFNTKNAYLFGNKTQQKIFFNEIKKKIYLCKKIGAKVIVFGSPSNKKIFSERNLDKLNRIAYNSFKKISKICEKYRICFCIEANPKIYNCEYLNYTKDAVRLVKKINSKFFKLNFDVGTVIENNESFKNVIEDHIKSIGHVQISVPYLKDIMPYKKTVMKFIKELKRNNYQKYISIERLPVKDNINNLEKTIKLVKSCLE